MCDIVDSDFEEKFPNILKVMKMSSFIAIDTEFTGLDMNIQDKHSLFDSAQERYSKLRQHAANFIICQIGLSCFVKDETKNRYEAHSFNFYVCPRSQGIVDSRFVFQSSCVEFLCQHNFDFNKFAYEGISYLNEPQEAELRKLLRKNNLFDGIRGGMDYNAVQDCCEKVSAWLATNPSHDGRLAVTVDRCVAAYVLHRKIRNDFEEVWTIPNPACDREIIVQKVSPEKRAELMEIGDDLQDRLIDNLIGFTRIFNALVRLKKPIVGHNLIIDLILMYNQFYRPVPKQFEKFKRDITDMFPKIFDTKHIAYEAHKIPELRQSTLYGSSILSDLYSALYGQKGQFLVLCSPEIRHAPGFLRYSDLQLLHEAGYDAYLAGFVFLRTAHIFSLYKKKSRDHVGLEFDRLLESVTTFRNKVNLIRANLAYVVLDGRDGSTKRPEWLVIDPPHDQQINVSEVTQMCSQYGSVDVKLLNSGKALVAVSNFRCARDIVKSFREKKMRVSNYRRIEHDRTLRFFVRCGAGTLGLIGSALLITAVRRLIV